MRAAAFGHAEAVAVLLAAGADPNRRRVNGTTSLCDAAFAESVEVVRLLVRHGADVNAAGADGCTPLMGAALQGDLQIARLLLETGSDPTLRGNFGVHRNKTALELARNVEKRSARQAMIDLLTPGGPTLEQRTEELEVAASAPAFRQLIELLIGLGAAPRPWKEAAGVFRCRQPTVVRLQQHFTEEGATRGIRRAVPKRRQAAALLGRLCDHVRSSGYQLVVAGVRTSALLLFPTSNTYSVLRACGTNGANYGHTTEDIIAWLQEMEAGNPFVMTACSQDYVAGKFCGPVRGVDALAKRMCAFCPSLIDGEVIDSPDQVAIQLEKSREFGLWWD
jgi:hypothetical protein